MSSNEMNYHVTVLLHNIVTLYSTTENTLAHYQERSLAVITECCDDLQPHPIPTLRQMS